MIWEKLNTTLAAVRGQRQRIGRGLHLMAHADNGPVILDGASCDMGYDKETDEFGQVANAFHQEWGVDITGATDAASTLQNINDTFVAKAIARGRATRAPITFPIGSLVKINSGLVCDVSHAVFAFNGAVIDATGIADGAGVAAIRFGASEYGAAGEWKASVESFGFDLRGKIVGVWNAGVTYAAGDQTVRGGKTWSSVAGGNTNHDPVTTSPTYWTEVTHPVRAILFEENDIVNFAGPYLHGLRNVSMTNFGVGLELGVNSFINSFYRLHITHCGIGINIPNSADAGEMYTFYGLDIFNGDLAIKAVNPNGDMSVHGGSLDYNYKVCDLQDFRLNLFGIHTEANGDQVYEPPFKISGSGGSLLYNGGTLEFPYSGSTMLAPYIVDCSSLGGSARFVDHFEPTTKTSTGIFATGAGHVERRPIGSYNDRSATCPYTSANADTNMLYDPSFAQDPTIEDLFFLLATADGEGLAVTDRFSRGTDCSITLSSGKIILTRNTNTMQVGLAVPIQKHGQFVHARFLIDKPGAGSGTIYFQPGYCCVGYNAHGVPYLISKVPFAYLYNPTFTSSPVSGMQMDLLADVYSRIPACATHYYIQINMTGMSAGGSLRLYNWLINQV